MPVLERLTCLSCLFLPKHHYMREMPHLDVNPQERFVISCDESPVVESYYLCEDPDSYFMKLVD